MIDFEDQVSFYEVLYFSQILVCKPEAKIKLSEVVNVFKLVRKPEQLNILEQLSYCCPSELRNEKSLVLIRVGVALTHSNTVMS